ncbi:MAG: spermidine synthase [Ornithinimicrobium sp.]|uniref:spermidine synthase n=1 Tax=Ornithinimicrobium sp. TaxID=1977084 RepID=UPI003D9AE888
MSLRFEELSFAPTRMGEISLRRRREPITGQQVYEVRLGEEYLMSSMFTVAEEAMADLALDWGQLADPRVLVGGLGLGYTAVAALRHADVAAVDVVETLQPVIDWHEQELLPRSAELVRDPRTRLLAGDFFAMVAGETPIEGVRSAYEVVLLDIDHAPDFVLDHSHQGFYSPAGLTDLCRLLSAEGVFALWSDRPPDQSFLDSLGAVFAQTRAEVVSFANPLTGGTSRSTVYLARAQDSRTEPDSCDDPA